MAVALAAALLAAVAAPAPLPADPLPVAVPERAEPVDFGREVAGILRANCLACHNAAKSEGGLVMESVAAMTQGGDGGPAVVPGKAEQSPLFLRAAHRLDDPMPPADNDAGARPLTSAELGLVRLWIDQGARGGDTVGVSAPRAWRRLPAGTGPVLAVAVSPDGGLVAGGRAGRLAVFDAATAAPLADLVDPALASGSGPGPAPAHADVVRAVAFDPRGERIASGGYREVKLWRRGREFVPLPAVAGAAAPAAAAGLVKIVEQARGAAVKRAAEPAARAAAVAKQDLAFEEEQLAAAVKEAAASRRAVETGRAAREAAAKAVAAAEEKRKAAESALAEARRAAAVLPAGAAPASPAADTKRLDDATKAAAAAATEFEQRRDEDVSAARVLEVALAGAARADAEQAAGEAAVAAMKQAVAAADAAVAERAREAERLPPIVAVAASAAEAAAVGPSGGSGGGHAGAHAGAHDGAHDGGTVAGLEADGTLHLATRAGRPLATLEPPPGVSREGFVGVAFAAEGRVAVRRGDGSGGSWPVAATWALEAVIGGAGDERTLPGFVTALAFSPDGRRLAVGCGEPARPGSIVLCDVASAADAAPGGVVTRLAGSHGDEPLGVAFEPRAGAAGGRLATVAADRTLRVFTVGAAVAPLLFEGHTQQVLGVSWQAHGRRIATASADGTVKIWDVPDAKQERSVAENGREATAVRFLGTGTELLVAATKGLRVVNAADGRTLRTCAESLGHVHAIDVSADGMVAAAASADGRMHLWATDGKTPARTIVP